MNLPEYIADGAWETVRRLIAIAFRLMIDTGGQSVGLRFGAATLTYTAAATSAATTVPHGLATTPSFVGSMGTTGLAKRHVVNYVSGSRNATDFQLQAETADSAAVTGSISVFWVVIG